MRGSRTKRYSTAAMLSYFVKKFKTEFGFRIDVAVITLICLMTAAYTSFFIFQQRAFMVEKMINEGMVLSRLLAFSARIGVFSENPDLLKGPVQGIMQQTGVLDVVIFNADGKMLDIEDISKGTRRIHHFQGLSIKVNHMIKLFRKDIKPKHVDFDERFEFWAAVTSQENNYSNEALFFDLEPHQHPPVGHITGYVMIAMDRHLLDDQIETLLFRGVLIGTAFIILGGLFSLGITRQVIKPLDHLTSHVTRLGVYQDVEEIPVETIDEIGKLAHALNEMSASLKNREQALLASQTRLRSLSSQLLKAQEDERRRLSRELHDSLGQSLAILKHQIRSLESQAVKIDPAVGDKFSMATTFIAQIIQDVRRISKDLSPSILEDIGLEAALQWLISNYREQHGNARVSVEINDIGEHLDKDNQTILFRLCQEALTNINKYAHATQVNFHLKCEGDFITVLIEDNGDGFDLSAILAGDRLQRGMGLATMEERAHMMGSELRIQSQPGEGTRIAFNIKILEEK